jgi:hypothetical protein
MTVSIASARNPNWLFRFIFFNNFSTGMPIFAPRSLTVVLGIGPDLITCSYGMFNRIV